MMLQAEQHRTRELVEQFFEQTYLGIVALIDEQKKAIIARRGKPPKVNMLINRENLEKLDIYIWVHY